MPILTSTPRKWSLQARILASCVLIAVAATSLITGYSVYHHLTESRQIIVSNFQLSTRIEEQHIRLRLKDAREQLLFLLNTGAVRYLATSWLPGIHPPDLPPVWRKRLESVFEGLLRVTRCCGRILLVDREGVEMVRVDWDKNLRKPIEPGISPNHSRSLWFQQSLLSAPETVTINLEPSDTGNETPGSSQTPLVRMTIPVYQVTGRIVGILAMDFLAAELFQTEESVFLYPEASWFLMNANGEFYHYRYRSEETLPFRRAEIERMVRTRYPDIHALPRMEEKEIQISGSLYHVCVTPVRLPDSSSALFWLGQAVPASVIHCSIREHLIYFSGILILSLGISLVVSYLLARQITRPIEQLRESANRIADGQLSERIEIDGGPELTDLAKDFNQMAQRLTQEMLWEKQYAQAIVNSIGDGVYSIDIFQKIRSWNIGAERITGFLATDILGRPCYEVLRHQDQQEQVFCRTDNCPITRVLSHSRTRSVRQAWIRRKTGGLIPVSLTASPLIAPDGRIMGAVEVFRDITREIEMIETICAADQAKSNFLSGMSHELITPLHAIIGFADVLAEQAAGPLNPDQIQYVEDIRESGKHLSRLLDQILELAKVKAGDTELDRTRFAVLPLVENSLTALRDVAARKQLQIRLDISENCRQATLLADERKLRRAMENLLANAVQFTPEKGQITVRLRIVSSIGLWDSDIPVDSPESSLDIVPKLEIMVEDTGMGIAPEHQAKIFQSFFQIHNGLQEKTPGAGLGLPLTRHFIELHHGGIRVESEGIGKGSRFIVRIPLSPDLQETDRL